MRAWFVLALFIGATVLTFARQGPSGAAAEEGAVRDVVARYVAAREKSDGAATASLFTEDADQLVSSGEWRRGRADVVRGTMASSKANAGTRTVTVETVRFPAAGVAIADGRYTIAGGAGGTRNMWSTFVMIKTGDSWRITAIRNMLPAAPAQ